MIINNKIKHKVIPQELQEKIMKIRRKRISHYYFIIEKPRLFNILEKSRFFWTVFWLFKFPINIRTDSRLFVIFTKEKRARNQGERISSLLSSKSENKELHLSSSLEGLFCDQELQWAQTILPITGFKSTIEVMI